MDARSRNISPKILLELAHVGDDAHASDLLNLLSKRGYQFFKVGGATLTALPDRQCTYAKHPRGDVISMCSRFRPLKIKSLR